MTTFSNFNVFLSLVRHISNIISFLYCLCKDKDIFFYDFCHWIYKKMDTGWQKYLTCNFCWFMSIKRNLIKTCHSSHIIDMPFFIWNQLNCSHCQERPSFFYIVVGKMCGLKFWGGKLIYFKYFWGGKIRCFKVWGGKHPCNLTLCLW